MESKIKLTFKGMRRKGWILAGHIKEVVQETNYLMERVDYEERLQLSKVKNHLMAADTETQIFIKQVQEGAICKIQGGMKWDLQ